MLGSGLFDLKIIYIDIFILQGPDLGGVFHCRCERTQTQQAQYNELGREAGLRTGTLWGLHQRLSRIIGEQDRQWRSWGEGQGPSSGLVWGWILLLLFWYSTNRTSWCLPKMPSSSSWDLSGYIYSSAPFIFAVHLSIAQVAIWVSVPSSASLHLLWVVVGSMALFRSHSFINAARLPAASI